MRRFTKFCVALDVVSLVGMIALVTVVYLCSLPETFDSLCHRKANAAGLVTHAHELSLKEGALFASLIHAADETSAVRLRQQLIDNERAFHAIATKFNSELPEATSDIETLVGQFDHVAAAGWRAAAAAPQSSPEERETLLDGNFANSLDELHGTSQRIEANLLHKNVAERTNPVRAFAKRLVSI